MGERPPFRLARDVIGHMEPGSAIINVTSTSLWWPADAAEPILQPRAA